MAGDERGAADRLFDLRTVIAVLFGVYGVVLLLVGAFGTGPGQRAKSGGLNLNLWTGGALVVLAALFVAWVRLRPLQPAEPEQEFEPEPGGPAAGARD